MDLETHFTRARQASVSLVAVTNADPAGCIEVLKPLTKINGDEVPILQWDCERGIQYFDDNPAGKQWLLEQDKNLIQGSFRIDRMLLLANSLPEDAVLFVMNPHMFWTVPEIKQAIWNKRDKLKAIGAMMVLLVPFAELPPELRDIVVMDEPLPSVERIESIMTGLYKAREEKTGKMPKLTKEALRNNAETLTSLSAFNVEQATAMALSDKGLDRAILWEQKKQYVKQIKGLSVDEGGMTLADMGGSANIARFGNRLFKGKEPPVVVVRVEEMEKKMGTEGEGGQRVSSEVGDDALDVYLNAMEDNGWTGIFCVGHPGTGKSWFSKCLANTYGALSLAQDINATRSKYMGESEMYIRENVKAIKAMAGSRAFFVATANKISVLPAALRRRFWMGVYFFDFPEEDEQLAVWKLHLASRGLEMRDLPDYRGWTQAEIRNCCELAWRFNISLKEASEYFIPVFKSDPTEAKALQEAANGRFLSASYPGAYHLPTVSTERKTRVQ